MIQIYDKRTQNAALAVSMLSAIFNSMGSSSVNVALPAIGQEFSMNAAMLGWVATTMILAASIFVVPFGKIADIFGRKKLMIIGTSVYTIGSILAALSVSTFFLLTSRVIQGIGASMIFGTSVAILTSVFPAEKRGWALGWNVSAVYMGLTAGPFIGGLLTSYLGWRYIFWLNVPLGILSLFFLVFMLKGEWAEAKDEKFDYLGSLILALLITCLIYGLSKMPSYLGGILLMFGIVLLFIFVKFEEKHVNPVVNMKLFENNIVFTYSNLATLIHYSSAFAVSIMLSLYLQYVKGFDPRHAGVILMAQPAVMMFIAPWAGKISDKYLPGTIAAIGMSMTMIGLVLFSFLQIDTPLLYIIVCLMFIGAGFGFFSSPNTNAIMSSVERRYYGVASGIISTMRQSGQMVGLAIATMFLSFFIGNFQITPDKHEAFLLAVKSAFIVFSVFCFFGIFASLAKGKQKGI
ncbi:MAG: MFS transporter [bacterium]